MRSISMSESVAVGSSRISTRASRVSMRAISTKLALAHRELPRPEPQRNVPAAEQFECLARAAGEFGLRLCSSGTFTEPSQILSSTERSGQKAQLLRDEGDAELLGLPRRGDRPRLARNRDARRYRGDRRR